MRGVVRDARESFSTILTPIIVLSCVYLIMLPQTRRAGKSFVASVTFVFLYFRTTTISTISRDLFPIPRHRISYFCSLPNTECCRVFHANGTLKHKMNIIWVAVGIVRYDMPLLRLHPMSFFLEPDKWNGAESKFASCLKLYFGTVFGDYCLSDANLCPQRTSYIITRLTFSTCKLDLVRFV